MIIVMMNHSILWVSCIFRLQTGFQAFNLNPATRGHQQQQFVPATLFLAADHIQVGIPNHAS